MTNTIKTRITWDYVGLLGLVGYLGLFLLMWKDSYFLIHDSLDVNGLLGALGTWETGWSLNNPVYQTMNGLPRSYFQMGFDFVLLLSTIFEDAFYVFFIDRMVVHIVAYVGMRLFLGKYSSVQQHPFPVWIMVGVALNHAFLPYLFGFGIGIAGIPLLTWALWNIHEHRRLGLSFAIVAAFPFYSSLAHNGVFIIAITGVVVAILALKTRRIGLLALAVIALGVGYCISAAPMIYSQLFLDTPVHRQEFVRLNTAFLYAIRNGFVLGNFYHSGSFHVPTLVLFLIASIVAWWTAAKSLQKALWIWFLGALSVSLIYAIYANQTLVSIIGDGSSTNSFDWSRFHYFRIICWNMVLAVALTVFTRWKKWRSIPLQLIWIGALVLQLGYTLSNNREFVVTSYNLVQRVRSQEAYKFSYSRYFAEQQYQEIADTIGHSQADYRVVSLGIPPAVAQHNGFYTLDSYQNLYPLAYKQQFRTIIEDELAASEKWRTYYDTWGSRAYVFSHELTAGYALQIDKTRSAPISDFRINTQALAEMGGCYILSAVLIENAKQNELNLISMFEDQSSAWVVYLYKVQDLDRCPA